MDSKPQRMIASWLTLLLLYITKEGISAFRFDFAGNGESEGEFQYGSYRKEAADLCCVVSYFSKQKYDIIALIGHSKGGNAVLLYASKYHDVPIVGTFLAALH